MAYGQCRLKCIWQLPAVFPSQLRSKIRNRFIDAENVVLIKKRGCPLRSRRGGRGGLFLLLELIMFVELVRLLVFFGFVGFNNNQRDWREKRETREILAPPPPSNP
jgi:hypothetical protein